MKNLFSQTMQDFFCHRLMAQRNASGQTIASYRDTFRLFLRYTQARLKKPPSKLTFDDMNADLVLRFLDNIEMERHNTIRSRNARLAAIRAFMHYAVLCAPSAINTIQRVLAIPSKRFEMPMMDFLSREEIESVIRSCSDKTWSGQRDHIMISTMYNTGARVSEITSLKVSDITFAHASYITVHGKGRKQRSVPLWKSTTKALKEWIDHNSICNDEVVFPNKQRKPLSRFGVVHRLQIAVSKASLLCPSLKKLRISPHTIRHTTAMHLLQSGVDITVIALWLGHESPATTHRYVEADLAMKESALEKLQGVSTGDIRYKPEDSLIEFLEKL
jgi:site-specific recombinase XerD